MFEVLKAFSVRIDGTEPGLAPQSCGLMEGEDMKFLIAAAVVATTVVGFGASANAAQGCGPGWHRGPYGACVRNAAVVVVRPAREVVVVRPGRVCPYGMRWYAGRCRY